MDPSQLSPDYVVPPGTQVVLRNDLQVLSSDQNLGSGAVLKKSGSVGRVESAPSDQGGQYSVHADAHIWMSEEKNWNQVLDRDLSLLLYINSEFEGGRLIFPNCNFTIAPSRGLLVAFPSDWRYIHGAYPVTKGVRYAIVSWAAAKGGPRVNPTPPDTAIRI